MKSILGAARALAALGAQLRRRLVSAENVAFRESLKEALTAHREGHFDAAFHLWEALRASRPDEIAAYLGAVGCARMTGRIEQAVAIGEEALERFGEEPRVLAELAFVRERQGDWRAAVELWIKAVAMPKAPPIWLQSYGYDLLVLGRADEVEPLLSDWRARFPEHQGFRALQGILAEVRREWDAAVAIWDDYRKRYPDDMTGWEHYGLSYQARQLARFDAGGDGAVGPSGPEAIDVVTDEDARALLLGFESIGADCEFGLVQRRFGAEPLGLLRFNAVDFGSLVAAVARGFEGMGAPELTELITLANGEYLVRDKRWGLGMHTFIFSGQQAPDELWPKLCRRIAFLRDKLLADLAEGRKVFVYNASTIGIDDLRMLHRALRALGPVKLMNARLAEAVADGFPPGAPGEAVEIDRGLFVGYISRPGAGADGHWDIAFDDWTAVCRAVRSILQDRAGVDSEPPPGSGT